MKYRIYRNLRKKCWSIQERLGGVWKVTAHCREFAAQNCTFKVYEKSRQRVIAQKRKNVHAFVIAESVMISQIFENSLDSFPKVCYDPYNAGNFICEDQPIEKAELLYFGPKALLKIQ